MEDEVRWRYEFARDLVGALPLFPGLCAAVIGGSVARGYSDPYSDIEVLLFWERMPDPATRRAILDVWRAEQRLHVGDHALLVRGVPIDLWQRTVVDEESILDRVLLDHSRDLTANAEVDMVHTGLPLRGAALVRNWRARTADYPEALAIGFLREQLPHFHLRQLGLAAVRDNPTAFYHTLSDLHCTLFLVLLALNGSYFPTFKWLYRRLDELPIAPAAAAARLRQMFREPPARRGGAAPGHAPGDAGAGGGALPAARRGRACVGAAWCRAGRGGADHPTVAPVLNIRPSGWWRLDQASAAGG